jgi:hypothetical protein
MASIDVTARLLRYEAPCQVPGDVHSDDRVRVYSGKVTPNVICGFHAQDHVLSDSFAKIRAAEEAGR